MDAILTSIIESEAELVCSVSLSGEAVELIVHLEGATTQEGRAAAHSVAKALPGLLPVAWENLVEAFLPIVNNGYLEAEAPPLSREGFLGRATLSGVSSDTDGNITFHYNDDGMLWGHWLHIDCRIDGTEWHAGVSG